MASFGLTLANRGVIIGAVTVAELIDMAERRENSGAFKAVWGACHSVTANHKGIAGKFADPRALQNAWAGGSTVAGNPSTCAGDTTTSTVFSARFRAPGTDP